ncbi:MULTISPECIES: thymidylate synthase [Leptospira]|uniref:thymidylate synthase n=1 Tax=Leptospira TaxID=171 RepID=UPI00214AD801|nr:thymidylate synthase [Leptospira sp. id769339]MCR1795790.1 thymidylate synthase [Leptospira sp. id769339]
MLISAETLDDLLIKIYKRIIEKGHQTKPTRGAAKELIGALVELKNPRARLSRTEGRGVLFSCLGELLWYLSKSNRLDFIKFYISGYEKNSDDGKTIYGAYGPRIFKKNCIDQFENVFKLLKKNPESRKAVIQLFDAIDIVKHHSDVPCTCTLQFFVRRKKLFLLTNMRSNDAYLGLPHDIFCFTMIQEIMAKRLDLELGTYKHFVGSLHLYDDDLKKADRIISEGFFEKKFMPDMPSEDPMPSIKIMLQLEQKIRKGEEVSLTELKLNPYWKDLLRLIKIFSLYKNRQGKEMRKQIDSIQSEMSHQIYDTYIERKKHTKKPVTKEYQRDLPYQP